MNNYFSSISRDESKNPPQAKIAPITQVPIVLSKEEKKVMLSTLPYLVAGHHTLVAQKRGKRKGKLQFPSPDQAAKLNKVYSMVKTFELTRIQSTATVPTQGAFNFDFNSVNDSGSLTAVFDQYRIAMIEMTFIPDANFVGVGTTSVPMFASAVDLDDSTSVSAFQLMDYPGCKFTLALKEHKHVFVPHCALAAYSGTFTSYANVTAPWIDVASPAVQHYGVKYAWEAAPTVAVYHIRVRMLLELRNVR